MTNTKHELEAPLLNSPETARFLGLQASGTLANWRWKGIGPPYIKVGHRIRYRMSDLQQWLEKRRVRNRL